MAPEPAVSHTLLLDDVKASISPHPRWIITPPVAIEELIPLFQRFADEFAVHGIGLTDVQTVTEAERLKRNCRALGRVHIWTKDRALKAREPDTEANAFVGPP